MTLSDVRFLDVGNTVYLYNNPMPWVISRLEFFDALGNEIDWESVPASCRVEMVIPIRDLSEGGRRRKGERIAEGSYVTIYTDGVGHMSKIGPPRKPAPLIIEICEEFDEIWMPEGHKYHGSNGPLY